MHLSAMHVTNFRRLKDVHIDFDEKTTIFVGSNNSGKTSATHVLDLFLGSKPSFTIYDFNADTWEAFSKVDAETADDFELPTINLDLWFKIEANDLHRVLAILPSLDWQDTPVGVRLQFGPRDTHDLLANYAAAKAAVSAASEDEAPPEGYAPWPQNLTDYLSKRLRDEYEVTYYVLDHSQFDDAGKESDGYVPLPISDERSGKAVIASLIRVDFLDAQRHLSDREGGGRAENLSRRLSRFYERNLDQFEGDFAALSMLANSENMLNAHLGKVFGPTLSQLNQLGYPGFADPHLEIRSAFNAESILTTSAKVHYAVQDPGDQDTLTKLTLPDQYNGLGFKNLIYMVVEILDFHQRWVSDKGVRPPVHLIMIEEPEAHLHAQLQQVFIRKILDILPAEDAGVVTQLAVTTHSPHIIYEDNFKPVRYFRRATKGQPRRQSEVLNLSQFYDGCPVKTRSFLAQYMKLTHSDLFFADAAILVEGNVERLLLPLFIERAAKELQSSYITVLELGGAFAHIFENLINFLGLTTLIITDLDSVHPKPSLEAKAIGETNASNEVEDESEADEEGSAASVGTCLPSVPGAVTSNQTLISWLPKLTSVAELLSASPEMKAPPAAEGSDTPRVCVAYQTSVDAVWAGETAKVAGRTLEEAFALENLAWTQDIERRPLGLRVVKKGKTATLEEMTSLIHKRVSGSSFDKTKFALSLMIEKPDDWVVPTYIRTGLEWLRDALPHSKIAAAILKVGEDA